FLQPLLDDDDEGLKVPPVFTGDELCDHLSDAELRRQLWNEVAIYHPGSMRPVAAAADAEWRGDGAAERGPEAGAAPAAGAGPAPRYPPGFAVGSPMQLS